MLLALAATTAQAQMTGATVRGHITAAGTAAPAGTGIIAGGPMRAIFEALGLKDVVGKSLGTSNPHNMVKACFAALNDVSSPRAVAGRRSKKVSDILGKRADAAEAKE